MPTVGPPSVTMQYRGIPVTIAQVGRTIKSLGRMSSKNSRGLHALGVYATESLRIGSNNLPSLASVLSSPRVAGRYNAARDGLQTGGYAVRRFMHNQASGPISPLLERFSLSAWEIRDKLYGLTIADRHPPGKKDPHWFEIDLAKYLGTERILVSTTVTLPVEVVEGSEYRLDIAPLIEVLSKLGATGDTSYYAQTMSSAYAAQKIMEFAQNAAAGGPMTPTYSFAMPAYPGLEVTLAITGCQFGHWDRGTKTAVIDTRQDGTVFTGPLLRNRKMPGEFHEPQVTYVVAQRRFLNPGEPALSALTTPELKQPMLTLAAGIAGMFGYGTPDSA